MRFEDWFYHDERSLRNNIRMPVNELDDFLNAFISSLEAQIRQAYEAGYKRGVQDSK
jgi:hypothetical protein